MEYMWRRTLRFILIGWVLIPAATWSEVFFWVDDQGIQYYATTLDGIPDLYRDRARRLPTPGPPPETPTDEKATLKKDVVSLPFTPGSPILVTAKIEGAGPVTLLLDTGSDRTLVSPSVLSRLGISTENGSPVMVKGVTGSSPAQTVLIKSLEVSDAKVGPIMIVSHEADFGGADGLLGRDFLGHFNVMIDPQKQIVTLESPP
jgi:hypothetical protein